MMIRIATPLLLVILVLFTSCGHEKEVPCQELVPPPTQFFGPPPVDWGLLDQQIQLDFAANELPTCREGKTTGALVTVTDPLNDELPSSLEVNAPADDFAHAIVRFQPVRVGVHHVVVRFLPIGGTSQRDVLITQPVAGTPLVLPYFCKEVIRLPGGTLICDEKVLSPQGALMSTLDESMARSAWRDELWAMRSQTVAHYREVDAGQLERLQSQSLSEPPGWVKLMGGPNEAIAVSQNGLRVLTPDGGAFSLSPTFASALAPNIESAMRVGDEVYLFSRDLFRNGRAMCGYRLEGTSFTVTGSCSDLGTPAVLGTSGDGFWTFTFESDLLPAPGSDGGSVVRAEAHRLTFTLPHPDGGTTQLASLRVPDSLIFQGGVSTLGADQLPIIQQYFPPYSLFVPVLVDGGIELRSLPAPQYSNASGNSTAIWWAVGNTTTVYPAP